MSIQGNNDTDLSLGKQEVKEIIRRRKSTFPKQFTGERIDDEVIEEILELANLAPTHKRTMPWRFIVFADAGLEGLLEFKKGYYLSNTPIDKQKASKVKAFDERKDQASHIIGLVAHIDQNIGLPIWEEQAAVAAAVQNIYLSLAPFGVAGYWSTGGVSESQEARAYLKLSDDEICMGFFYLGKPAVNFEPLARESAVSRTTWKRS